MSDCHNMRLETVLVQSRANRFLSLEKLKNNIPECRNPENQMETFLYVSGLCAISRHSELKGVKEITRIRHTTLHSLHEAKGLSERMARLNCSSQVTDTSRITVD